MDEYEEKAARLFIDNTPVGDPDPIELRARIVILEGLVIQLIKSLPPAQIDHLRAELREAGEVADDLNASSKAHTVGEEIHHQLNVAAREILARLD